MDSGETLWPAHFQSTHTLRQNMRKKNRNVKKNNKKLDNIYLLRDTVSSTDMFMEDINISEKEMTTAMLHSAQPMRNLPNILKNNCTKTYRNYKTPTLTSISSAEDANTSIELNVASSSTDSEKEGKYNKIASPKSYHQRKQVHNPLDAQYDIPDWNNNEDNVLQAHNDKDMLYFFSRDEENTLTKKSKLNNKRKDSGRKSLANKKSRQITSKVDNRAEESDEKFNSYLTIASDKNIIDDIVGQNIDNPFSDVFTQNIVPESNISSCMYDLYDIGTESNKFSDISCYNNNVSNSGKNCDINFNTIIPDKLTESNTMQYKTFQKDIPHYNTSKIEDNLGEDLLNRDITSNLLFASNEVHTCTCKNCTSRDKDVILYEDPVPSCISNDIEADIFTPYAYDFYTSDYYHILGDNWLGDFNKKSCYFGEIEETNVTKENADDANIKLIDSNVNNMSTSINQNESQSLQVSHIDKIQQDICAQSYPTELNMHSDELTKSLKTTEHIKILEETGYLNVGSISMEENASRQNKVHLQTVSPSIPVSKFGYQQYKEEAANVFVIRCGHCGKLFYEKHQFRKHFTHCILYKEDFKCDICDRIYRYKQSLVQHLKKIHRVSSHNAREEASYKCDKCEKLYVRFRAFKKHLLLHEETWCKEKQELQLDTNFSF